MITIYYRWTIYARWNPYSRKFEMVVILNSGFCILGLSVNILPFGRVAFLPGFIIRGTTKKVIKEKRQIIQTNRQCFATLT